MSLLIISVYNMSVDQQIISLLEVITYIITKLSNEEARSIKTTIFSDYFRKHLNLIDEQKKGTKGNEKCIKDQLDKNIVEKNHKIASKNHELGKEIEVITDKVEINNLANLSLQKPLKEKIDMNSHPKRPRLAQNNKPLSQDLILKAQPLDSIIIDKRKINMEALNEKIFDAKLPTVKNQTQALNQCLVPSLNQNSYLNNQNQDFSIIKNQVSMKVNRTLTSSTGLALQIDKVMAIKESSPVNNVRNTGQGYKIHCPLCKRYYYTSQRHYCFTVSNGKEICCNMCEKRFDSINSFKIHFSMKHFQEYRDKVEAQTAKQCGTCLTEFENAESMIVHVREEHEGKPRGWPMMHCPSCDQVFANADYLLEHITDIHERDETVLDYSGIIEGTYKLTEASVYYEEIKKDTPNFKCMECGMRFSKNETLIAHQNLHVKK